MYREYFETDPFQLKQYFSEWDAYLDGLYLHSTRRNQTKQATNLGIIAKVESSCLRQDR